MQLQLAPRAASPSLARLARWEERPFSPGTESGPRPGDRQDLYERALGVEPPGAPAADGPYARARAAILRYDVFSPRRLRGLLRRAPVVAGDTIGISYRLVAGVELFFAARVTEAFDERSPTGARAGFTYRTLAGHPELGEERFAVEKEAASGRVVVRLAAWSRPGTLLARLGAPLLRRMQLGANRGALEHLAAVAAAAPAPTPGAAC